MAEVFRGFERGLRKAGAFLSVRALDTLSTS